MRLVRGHPWGGGGPRQPAAKRALPGLCPGSGTLRTPDSLAAPTRAPRLERYTGSRWGRQSVLLLPSGGTASWSQVGKCKHRPPKPHRDSPTGAKNTPHWQQTSSPVFPKRQWATGCADLVGVRQGVRGGCSPTPRPCCTRSPPSSPPPGHGNAGKETRHRETLCSQTPPPRDPGPAGWAPSRPLTDSSWLAPVETVFSGKFPTQRRGWGAVQYGEMGQMLLPDRCALGGTHAAQTRPRGQGSSRAGADREV